jgi:hypothetical protein
LILIARKTFPANNLQEPIANKARCILFSRTYSERRRRPQPEKPKSPGDERRGSEIFGSVIAAIHRQAAYS